MRVRCARRVDTGDSIVMILSALVIVGTLVSDILLAVIDPRIRFGRSAG